MLLVPAIAALVKLVLASLVGGIGVALVFSVAILGLTRAADRREERRGRAGAAYSAVGVAGLVLSAAIVVLGIVLVAHKS